MGTNPERDSLRHGDRDIVYSIVRSPKRNTLGITIYPTGEVKVSVPAGMRPEQIRRLALEKASWIARKLQDFEAQGCRDAAKRYVDGELFLFQGHAYVLRISEGPGPIVTLGGSTLNVIVPLGSGTDAIEKAVLKWYRFQAEMALDAALVKYSGRVGILPPHYKVKNLNRRWGSCTAKNLLNFNVKIVMAPADQFEYVVAHELCHVRVKDHSPRFWALMEQVMPGYKAAKSGLRKEGWKYEL